MGVLRQVRILQQGGSENYSGKKSSFANSLETDLFDMNPNVDFVVLSFNMEINFETLF